MSRFGALPRMHSPSRGAHTAPDQTQSERMNRLLAESRMRRSLWGSGRAGDGTAASAADSFSASGTFGSSAAFDSTAAGGADGVDGQYSRTGLATSGLSSLSLGPSKPSSTSGRRHHPAAAGGSTPTLALSSAAAAAAEALAAAAAASSRANASLNSLDSPARAPNPNSNNSNNSNNANSVNASAARAMSMYPMARTGTYAEYFAPGVRRVLATAGLWSAPAPASQEAVAAVYAAIERPPVGRREIAALRRLRVPPLPTAATANEDGEITPNANSNAYTAVAASGTTPASGKKGKRVRSVAEKVDKGGVRALVAAAAAGPPLPPSLRPGAAPHGHGAHGHSQSQAVGAGPGESAAVVLAPTLRSLLSHLSERALLQLRHAFAAAPKGLLSQEQFVIALLALIRQAYADAAAAAADPDPDAADAAADADASGAGAGAHSVLGSSFGGGSGGGGLNGRGAPVMVTLEGVRVADAVTAAVAAADAAERLSHGGGADSAANSNGNGGDDDDDSRTLAQLRSEAGAALAAARAERTSAGEVGFSGAAPGKTRQQQRGGSPAKRRVGEASASASAAAADAAAATASFGGSAAATAAAARAAALTSDAVALPRGPRVRAALAGTVSDAALAPALCSIFDTVDADGLGAITWSRFSDALVAAATDADAGTGAGTAAGAGASGGAALGAAAVAAAGGHTGSGAVYLNVNGGTRRALGAAAVAVPVAVSADGTVSVPQGHGGGHGGDRHHGHHGHGHHARGAAGSQQLGRGGSGGGSGGGRGIDAGSGLAVGAGGFMNLDGDAGDSDDGASSWDDAPGSGSGAGGSSRRRRAESDDEDDSGDVFGSSGSDDGADGHADYDGGSDADSNGDGDADHGSDGDGPSQRADGFVSRWRRRRNRNRGSASKSGKSGKGKAGSGSSPAAAAVNAAHRRGRALHRAGARYLPVPVASPPSASGVAALVHLPMPTDAVVVLERRQCAFRVLTAKTLTPPASAPFPIAGHEKPLLCAAHLPGLNWLATSAGDNTIRFWDASAAFTPVAATMNTEIARAVAAHEADAAAAAAAAGVGAAAGGGPQRGGLGAAAGGTGGDGGFSASAARGGGGSAFASTSFYHSAMPPSLAASVAAATAQLGGRAAALAQSMIQCASAQTALHCIDWAGTPAPGAHNAANVSNSSRSRVAVGDADADRDAGLPAWAAARSGGTAVLASGADGSNAVNLWRVGRLAGGGFGRARPLASELLLSMHGHSDAVLGLLAPREAGTVLFSASMDRTVATWDLATGTRVRSLQGHGHGVFALAYSPGPALLVSAGFERAASVWDPRWGRRVGQLRSPHPLTGIVAVPETPLVATSDTAGCVRLWDLRMGLGAGGNACLQALPVADPQGRRVSTLSALAIAPQHRRLLCGSTRVHAVDAAQSTAAELPGLADRDPVAQVAYDAVRGVFWTSVGAKVKTWDAETGVNIGISEDLGTLPLPLAAAVTLSHGSASAAAAAGASSAGAVTSTAGGSGASGGAGANGGAAERGGAAKQGFSGVGAKLTGSKAALAASTAGSGAAGNAGGAGSGSSANGSGASSNNNNGGATANAGSTVLVVPPAAAVAAATPAPLTSLSLDATCRRAVLADAAGRVTVLNSATGAIMRRSPILALAARKHVVAALLALTAAAAVPHATTALVANGGGNGVSSPAGFVSSGALLHSSNSNISAASTLSPALLSQLREETPWGAPAPALPAEVAAALPGLTSAQAPGTAAHAFSLAASTTSVPGMSATPLSYNLTAAEAAAVAAEAARAAAAGAALVRSDPRALAAFYRATCVDPTSAHQVLLAHCVGGTTSILAATAEGGVFVLDAAPQAAATIVPAPGAHAGGRGGRDGSGVLTYHTHARPDALLVSKEIVLPAGVSAARPSLPPPPPLWVASPASAAAGGNGSGGSALAASGAAAGCAPMSPEAAAVARFLPRIGSASNSGNGNNGADSTGSASGPQSAAGTRPVTSSGGASSPSSGGAPAPWVLRRTAAAESSLLSLLAVGGADGSVVLWDPRSQAPAGVLRGHACEITCLHFLAPYPLLLSADVRGNVCLWLVRPLAASSERCVLHLWNVTLRVDAAAAAIAAVRARKREIHRAAAVAAANHVASQHGGGGSGGGGSTARGAPMSPHSKWGFITAVAGANSGNGAGAGSSNGFDATTRGAVRTDGEVSLSLGLGPWPPVAPQPPGTRSVLTTAAALAGGGALAGSGAFAPQQSGDAEDEAPCESPMSFYDTSPVTAAALWPTAAAVSLCTADAAGMIKVYDITGLIKRLALAPLDTFILTPGGGSARSGDDASATNARGHSRGQSIARKPGDAGAGTGAAAMRQRRPSISLPEILAGSLALTPEDAALEIASKSVVTKPAAGGNGTVVVGKPAPRRRDSLVAFSSDVLHTSDAAAAVAAASTAEDFLSEQAALRRRRTSLLATATDSSAAGPGALSPAAAAAAAAAASAPTAGALSLETARFALYAAYWRAHAGALRALEACAGGRGRLLRRGDVVLLREWRAHADGIRSLTCVIETNATASSGPAAGAAAAGATGAQGSAGAGATPGGGITAAGVAVCAADGDAGAGAGGAGVTCKALASSSWDCNVALWDLFGHPLGRLQQGRTVADTAQFAERLAAATATATAAATAAAAARESGADSAAASSTTDSATAAAPGAPAPVIVGLSAGAGVGSSTGSSASGGFADATAAAAAALLVVMEAPGRLKPAWLLAPEGGEGRERTRTATAAAILAAAAQQQQQQEQQQQQQHQLQGGARGSGASAAGAGGLSGLGLGLGLLPGGNAELAGAAISRTVQMVARAGTADPAALSRVAELVELKYSAKAPGAGAGGAGAGGNAGSGAGGANKRG